MSVTELGPHEQEFERTPPHDISAEQGVIGGMLLSQDAIAEVIELLRTHDFYRPAHQIIFDTILDLYGRGDPADAVTIAGELTKRGEIARIGGAPYLHTLISSVPTAANAGYYAKIVRERSVLRKLVETGTRIVQMGYAADGADADDVLDRAQAEVFAIAEKRTGEDYVPLSEIMPGALDEIEAIGSRGGQMVGVPTGFADLDALTNGLHPGQMIVVAARPAMGKALKTDIPLPTPTGWTTMGEVQVGDYLIGADGRPTRVVAATEIMHGRPCYEIEFSDGEVIVADAQHQWRTTTRTERVDGADTSPYELVLPTGGGKAAAGARGVAEMLHERRRTRPRPRPVENSGAHGSDAAFDPYGVVVVDEAHRSLPWKQFPGNAWSVQARVGGVDAGRPRGRAGRRPAVPHRLGGHALRDHALARRVAAGDSGGRTRVRTTREIAATLREAGGDRPNHFVEVAAPFRLPAVDLPIDPYLLGVWLGAGNAGNGRLSCCGGQVASEPTSATHAGDVAAVCADEDETIAGVASGPWAAHHRVPPKLRERFAEAGLLADEMHIPDVYLRASEEQRRALLAGILDGDGRMTESGRVRLRLRNGRLAEGVRELVLSLGHQVTRMTRPTDGRAPGDWVEFTPTGPLPGSARQPEVVRPEARGRYIVDVRPVESVPVRCVQVDNADHMYLAGRSCIPTHNSTLALDFARAASIKHGLTSAFFSLEMGRNEITMRLLSAEARVALHAMRSGTMQDEDWTRLARRMSEVAEAPLFIDDSPNMSMMEIRAKCRRLKQQHDLRLVIIDYLQLMTSGKRVESRQVEVSEFSRSLKLLAKELGVPVIALSQLNRGPEQRTDKKPMVSDLRESGSIEQDADMVVLLHREDAYEKESPRAGEADLIVAKHRNGPTATVTVAFQGHYSRFVDMAQ